MINRYTVGGFIILVALALIFGGRAINNANNPDTVVAVRLQTGDYFMNLEEPQKFEAVVEKVDGQTTITLSDQANAYIAQQSNKSVQINMAIQGVFNGFPVPPVQFNKKESLLGATATNAGMADLVYTADLSGLGLVFSGGDDNTVITWSRSDIVDPLGNPLQWQVTCETTRLAGMFNGTIYTPMSIAKPIDGGHAIDPTTESVAGVFMIPTWDANFTNWFDALQKLMLSCNSRQPVGFAIRYDSAGNPATDGPWQQVTYVYSKLAPVVATSTPKKP